MDTNPFINLQPIFRDYESYFKDLETKKIVAESKVGEIKNKEAAVSSMSSFVFKAVENVPDSTTGKLQEEKNNSVNKTPQFSFGVAPTSTTSISKPSFSFGSNPVTSSVSFGKYSFNNRIQSNCTTLIST